MNPLHNRWLWAGGVVVLVLAGVWLLLGLRSAKPQYRTASVEMGAITASVSATGTVRPVVQVAVGSQVSGTIDKLHVDYNDRVSSGQLLAELEPSFYRTAVVQAEANVSRAEAALHEAERALRRAHELTERKVMAEVELETAETTFEQRQAELEQARASLETARVNLGHTRIRSPIDGVVLARSVDVGQTVAASLQAPQLYLIAGDLTKMQIETKIDEADIGQVQIGLPVSFTVDAFPERRFRGAVSQVRLEPIVEDNVVTYTTVIEVANPERLLRPGMTANVTIVVAERTDILRVPNAALRFRPPEGEGPPRGTGAGREAALAGTPGAAQAAPSGRGAPDSLRRRGRGDGSGPGALGDTTGGGAGELAGGRERKSPSKSVYRLTADGTLELVSLRTGVTDGAFTEVLGNELVPGDKIVVGMDSENDERPNMSPPPGFGRGGR